MTEALAGKTCTPCRGGIPPLTREQAELFHAQAPDWQLLEEAQRIERSFRFRNFREALTFVRHAVRARTGPGLEQVRRCAAVCEVMGQQETFPPPALPGFRGTPNLSATPRYPACPLRGQLHPGGLCSRRFSHGSNSFSRKCL
jgi:hypothetical protein